MIRFRLFVCAVVVCIGTGFLQAVYSSYEFVESQVAAGISSSTSANNCAWGDYDNDGDLDLYIAAYGYANQLYENNGNNTFTEVGALAGVDDTSSGNACAWGDYDNDGDLDLYVVNYGQPNKLYRNNGDKTFSVVAQVQDPAGTGIACSWMDYDRDGWLDLYVVNYQQANILYRNNKNGTFTASDQCAGEAGMLDRSAAWADYDNDGDTDLYIAGWIKAPILDAWGAPTGKYTYYVGQFYLNNGNGTFTASYDASLSNKATSCVWGDYDNDGDMDLFISYSDLQNRLLQNNGAGAFTNVAVAAGVNVITNCVSSSWIDFDNDGDLDLYGIRNNAANILYKNNGAGVFSEVAATQLVNDSGAGAGGAWADYDNDGDLDLYIPADNKLYRNNGGANSYVQFDLSSLRSNASAIGARVTVTPEGMSAMTREVSGGNGSQDQLRVHFGISGAAALAQLKTRWLYSSPQKTNTYTTRYASAVNRIVTLYEADFSSETAQMDGLAADTEARSGAWADYDGDGDLDLYISYYGTANKLFRHEDDGTFTEVAALAGVDDTGQGCSAAWGDFDNDGDPDLYVSNYGQENKLYKNNGDGTFTDESVVAGVSDSANSFASAWGDYDNDGDLDLYVANSSQANRLYKNNGDGTFTEIGSTLGLTDNGSARACAWVDFDNDGDLDIFVLNYGQSHKLYRNNGNGTFLDVAGAVGLAEARNAQGCAWGDYDNDGDLDLYVANIGQANQLLRNTNGVFADQASTANVNSGLDSYASAWGDYDNDGDLDLYVANYSGESILYQNSNGVFTDKAFSAGVNDNAQEWSCVWEDYNNDGWLDLFLPVAGRLYRNRLDNNNFIKIAVDPEDTNKSGNGVRITLEAGGKIQTRELGTDGSRSQSQLIAHFGIGSETSLESITIRWLKAPARTVVYSSTIHNFVNETITINEEAFGDNGDNAGIETSTLIRGNGWADYDNDGDQDLYVVYYNGPNKLYRNTGSGFFEEVGVTASVNDSRAGMACAWGDYDNDGYIDLYVVNESTANVLYHNRGDGVFTEEAVTANVNDGSAGYCAAWGDYDRDGDLDLFVVNYGQPNRLYRNDGDGSFTDIAASAWVDDSGNSYSCAWIDYDRDRDPDIFVVNDSGVANYLYRNNGDGTFTEVAGNVNLADTGSGRAFSWGDFDNDGDHDLYVANDGQANRLYRNNNGVFQEIAGAAGVADAGNSQACAWADYNNDGYLDLYVVNEGQANRLYRNNGDSTFTDIARIKRVDFVEGGLSCAWGDYDADRNPDLFVGNAFFDNPGEGNNYAAIRFVPVVTNKNSVGVHVTLVSGGVTQSREVMAGNGSRSQDQLEPVFGLGNASEIDLVRVEWGASSNRVVVLTGEVRTMVNQTITLFEADFIDVSVNAGVTGGDAARHTSWVDYDNDGDQDIFVVYYGAANKLFQNNNDFTFTGKAVQAGIADTGNGVYGTWGDYDNDGDLDLYIVCDGSANLLYRNDGSGRFTNVAESSGVNYSGNGSAAAWGDYDNDGDLDLYVANSNEANLLYQNDGSGIFTDIGAVAGVADGGTAKDCAWIDYDNDGDQDLYVLNYGTVKKLFRNNGGAFNSVEDVAGLNDVVNGVKCTWGDYNNDGFSDLYVVNDSGANLLYKNDGDGTFSEVGNIAGTDHAGSGLFSVWADYDNDGYLDLTLLNNGEENVLYRNLGDGTFSPVADSSLALFINSNTSCAWGDIDGDGCQDVFLPRSGSLFQNQGAMSNYVRVALRGAQATRYAFGARVRLKAGGRDRYAEVNDGASGGLIIHFGLGETDSIEELSVFWPKQNPVTDTYTSFSGTNATITVSENMTFRSVGSGNWSEWQTWDHAVGPPGTSAEVRIETGHTVLYDITATTANVSTINVLNGGTLQLNPGARTLWTRKNVNLSGNLILTANNTLYVKSDSSSYETMNGIVVQDGGYLEAIGSQPTGNADITIGSGDTQRAYIRLAGASRLNLRNTKLSYLGSTAGQVRYSIDQEPGGAVTLDAVSMDDCYSVRLKGSNNYLNASEFDSMELLFYGSRNRVQQNVIRGSVASYNILLDGSNENQLLSNRLLGIAEYGILVSGNGILGNTISGNMIASASVAGILVDRSDNNTLSSNTIYSCLYGIVLRDNADDNLISDSDISNNIEAGIVISNSAARTAIVQSTIAGNGPFGLLSDSSMLGLTISSTNITGHDTYGMIINSTQTGSSVTLNNVYVTGNALLFQNNAGSIGIEGSEINSPVRSLATALIMRGTLLQGNGYLYVQGNKDVFIEECTLNAVEGAGRNIEIAGLSNGSLQIADSVLGNGNGAGFADILFNPASTGSIRVIAKNTSFNSTVPVTGSVHAFENNYLLSLRHNKMPGLTYIWGNYEPVDNYVGYFSYGNPSYYGAGDENTQKRVIIDGLGKVFIPKGKTLTVAGTSENRTIFANSQGAYSHKVPGFYQFRVSGNINLNYADLYQVTLNGLELLGDCTVQRFDNVRHYERANGSIHMSITSPNAILRSPFVNNRFSPINGGKNVRADKAVVYFDTRSADNRGGNGDVVANGGMVHWGGGSFETRQDGNWSDPSTWLQEVVPGVLDGVIIKHSVIFDSDHNNSVTCAGVTINAGAKLSFKTAAAEREMNVSGNVIVNGSLVLTRNSTLKIVCRVSGEYGCVVNSGGRLEMFGESGSARNAKITAYNTTFKTYAELKQGSDAVIRNAEISYLGVSTLERKKGFKVTGIDNSQEHRVYINNSDFHHNYIGLYLDGVQNITTTGNRYYNNEVGLQITTGEGFVFADNKYYANTIGMQLRDTPGIDGLREEFGVAGVNTQTDINLADFGTGSSAVYTSSQFGSTTKVSGIDYVNHINQKILSRTHNGQKGVTAVWGRLVIGSGETYKFNYAENTQFGSTMENDAGYQKILNVGHNSIIEVGTNCTLEMKGTSTTPSIMTNDNGKDTHRYGFKVAGSIDWEFFEVRYIGSNGVQVLDNARSALLTDGVFRSPAPGGTYLAFDNYVGDFERLEFMPAGDNPYNVRAEKGCDLFFKNCEAGNVTITGDPNNDVDGTSRIVWGTIKLDFINIANRLTQNKDQGDTNIECIRFGVLTDHDVSAWNSLNVELMGDIPYYTVAVKLYKETSGNSGVLEPAKDTLLASGSFLPDRTTDLAIVTQSVASVPSYYYLALDVMDIANPGSSFGVRVASGSCFAVDKYSEVASANLPLASGLVSVNMYPSVIYVSGENLLTSGTLDQDTEGVGMLRLDLRTDFRTAVWDWVKVRGAENSQLNVGKVSMYLESGTEAGFQQASDYYVGGGIFEGNVAKVTFPSSQGITPVTRSYYVVYDVAVDAVSGNSVQAGIRYSGDYGFKYPASLDENSFREVTSNVATVRMTRDKVIVNMDYLGVPDNIVQGDQKVVLGRVGLKTEEHNAKLRLISVKKLGSIDSAQVSNLGIYKDVDGDNVYDVTGDIMVSESAPDYIGGKWVFAVSEQTIGESYGYYFIIGDISIDTPIGKTIGLDLVSTADIGVSEPDYVFQLIKPAASDMPIQAYPSTVLIQGISNSNIPPRSAMLGQQDIWVKSLRLKTDMGKVSLSALNLKLSGSGTNADVSGIRIYRDINNGEYDRNDELIASVNGFAITKTKTIAFSGSGEQISNVWQYYHVVYDVASGGEAGHTVGLEISTSDDFGFQVWSPDGSVSVNVPITSNLCTLSASPSKVLVRSLPVVIGSVYQGDTGKPLFKVGCKTDAHDAYLESLRVRYAGDNPGNVSNLRVYRDSNGSGTFEITDTLVSSEGYGFSDGVVQIPFSQPQQVNVSEQYYFVIGDVSLTAASGNVIRLEMPSKVYIGIDTSGLDYVGDENFPNVGSAISIKPTVDKINVRESGSAPNVVTQGDRDVLFKTLVMEVDASAQGNAGMVQQIKLELTGTAGNASVANVAVWVDNTGATANVGAFHPSTDSKVTQGTNTFVGGVCILSIIPQGQSISKTGKTYFVSLDIAEAASPNQTIGIRLSSEDNIVVQSPDYVSTFNAAIASGESTVWKKKAMVTVAGTDLTLRGINQGSTGVPVLEFGTRARDWYSYLKQVNLSLTGTLPMDEVGKVYLYERIRTVSEYAMDDSEAMAYLSEGTPDQFGQVPLTFGGAGLVLSEDVTRNFVVYLDVVDEATVSGTIGVRINSEDELELRDALLSGWDEVSSRNMPLYTRQMIIYDQYKPTKPKIVMNDRIGSLSRVEIEWQSVAKNGVTDVEYAIGSQSGASDVVHWSLADGSRTSLTISNIILDHARTYYVTVKTRSIDGQGNVTESDPTSKAFVVDGTPPETTTVNINLYNDRSSVAVNWTLAAEDMSDIVAYWIEEKKGFLPQWHVKQIILKKNSPLNLIQAQSASKRNSVILLNSYGGAEVVPADIAGLIREVDILDDSVTRMRFDNLDPAGTYYYRVRSQNSAGVWSDYSDPSPAAVLGTATGNILYNLVVYPNPFDSNKEEVSIGYGLSEDANVSVRIYTPFGMLVKEYSFNAGTPGGMAGERDENILHWDGRNDAGNPVGKGGYIVIVEASNSSGKKALKEIIGVNH